MTIEEGTTVFSPDRKYRYRLEREVAEWDSGNKGICCFILLNPSTADEERDDPTIRRCARYARDWGYRRLRVVNLFGYRATKPADMLRVIDPFGPENAHYVWLTCHSADLVVAAWGAHGEHRNAGRNLLISLRHHGVKVHVLGLTSKAQPVHPLYQRADLVPEELA